MQTEIRIRSSWEVESKAQIFFQTSSFQSILRLRKIKLASQIMHQLLLRMTKTMKKKEAWFKNEEKHTKFRLQEFILMTSLNTIDCEDVNKTLGTDFLIVKN